MEFSALVVGNEDSASGPIGVHLGKRGFRVCHASSVSDGLGKMRDLLPTLVLLDLNMPDGKGSHFIRTLRARNRAAAIIAITAHGDLDRVVKAIKSGANDVIQKPFSLGDLDRAVDASLNEHPALLKPLHVEENGFRLSSRGWTILGASDAMKEIYRQIVMVSQARKATVLIQGESGTGKELVARAIYVNSHAEDSPFIDINCAALSDNLLEAELFGHEKGAFTGADKARSGLFGAADGGTLFLDEIGEMPLNLQATLLRVLEEGTYKRVGGTKNLSVDCRIMASTNRDLWKMVEEKTFRKDLFYRLDVFSIFIPPLRERPADIPILSAHFLKEIGRQCGKDIFCFSKSATDKLLAHDWPGNIRELRNVVERAVILSRGNTIEADEIFLSSEKRREEAAGRNRSVHVGSIREMEKQLIRRVLERTDWHKARSAEILGINRTTLWQKLKDYGIEAKGS